MNVSTHHYTLHKMKDAVSPVPSAHVITYIREYKKISPREEMCVMFTIPITSRPFHLSLVQDNSYEP